MSLKELQIRKEENSKEIFKILNNFYNILAKVNPLFKDKNRFSIELDLGQQIIIESKLHNLNLNFSKRDYGNNLPVFSLNSGKIEISDFSKVATLNEDLNALTEASDYLKENKEEVFEMLNSIKKLNKERAKINTPIRDLKKQEFLKKSNQLIDKFSKMENVPVSNISAEEIIEKLQPNQSVVLGLLHYEVEGSIPSIYIFALSRKFTGKKVFNYINNKKQDFNYFKNQIEIILNNSRVLILDDVPKKMLKAIVYSKPKTIVGSSGLNYAENLYYLFKEFKDITKIDDKKLEDKL